MAVIDWLLVTDVDIVEACEEKVDDRHTEGFMFILDDDGTWWAKSNVRGVGFTEARWWRVTGGFVPDDLTAILEQARSLMRRSLMDDIANDGQET